ncbi:hypothetical protein LR48_Vigan09g127600 [Vigna angularis]|uniref:Uncharacterized protein n=1 Tax=Phaseolus angularis TaxID=3914 RepID=A0A0L9VCH4_PHAAN|nr:hypothetical protein LR48_Vigan09g127600 [Vigna angularis]
MKKARWTSLRRGSVATVEDDCVIQLCVSAIWVDGNWRMKKLHDDVAQRRKELAIRFRDACDRAFGTVA